MGLSQILAYYHLYLFSLVVLLKWILYRIMHIFQTLAKLRLAVDLFFSLLYFNLELFLWRGQTLGCYSLLSAFIWILVSNTPDFLRGLISCFLSPTGHVLARTSGAQSNLSLGSSFILRKNLGLLLNPIFYFFLFL